MEESKEELKSLLMKVKESEKADLKLNIQKMKIMASGPISSWTIRGEKMEIVTDFIILGSKITVDTDWSYEIKRKAWKKSYDKPRQHIKKQRHLFGDKREKAVVFPIVLYGCENWTIKKAECWRIDAFKLWC